MSAASVAIVMGDPSLRPAVARAFDRAPSEWTVVFQDSPPADADIVVVDDPGADGVLFEADHPEALVPAIEARLARIAPVTTRVIAVTGLSGAGVTSLGLHLAATWAGRHQTLFLDLDRTWGCADRLGLGDDVVTWTEEETSSRSPLPAVPLAGGLRAVVAPRAASEPPRGLVRKAAGEVDRVVVDLPIRHHDSAVTACADAVLFVMSPSLPHAHRAVRVLPGIGAARVVIVTNRLGRGGETTRYELEAVLGRRVGLELPCFPGLRDAEGHQRIVSLRWSRWGHAVARLARGLDRL